jgi:single-strand DNA-binding protein
MAFLNSVTLMGNAAADGELTYIGEKETPCLNFTLGVTYHGPNGFREISFFRCQRIGKQADQVEVKKGDHIVVDGRLRQNRWKSQEGKNQSTIIVHIQMMYVMHKKIEEEYDEGDF